MKICLIGHHSKYPDEGVRNVAAHIAKELSKYHEVMVLDIRKVLYSWKDIKSFNPEVIHFVVGPSTVLSFAVAKALSLFNNARVVMSALQPSPFWFRGLVHLMKPDLMLTQSYKYEEMFKDLGCKTKFLPNGVDIDRFVPVSEKFKEQLREKYRIEMDKFVILHVGPVKKRRNIEVFEELQKEGNHVIIIGRESQERDMTLYQTLEKKGCRIWTHYLKNIEEVYALSDCYVFPTFDEYSCIEMPLSVLEAMACNLPVVTTKFRALPRAFDEEEGLFFVERDENFFKGIEKLKNGNLKVKTREKVLLYSWETVAQRLGGIYNELFYSS